MKRKTKFLFAIAGLLSISILTLIILISIPVKVVFHTNESELNKKNSIHQIEVTPNFNKNNTEIISISDLFSIKFGKISRIVRKSDSKEININDQVIKIDPRFTYDVEIDPYFGRKFNYQLVFNYKNSILLKHSNNPTNILKIIPKEFVGKNLSELYSNYPEIKNQFIYENKDLTKPILNTLYNVNEIYIANYESQEAFNYEIIYKLDDISGKDIFDAELGFRNHIKAKGIKGQVIPFNVPLIQGYDTPKEESFILKENNQKYYVIYKENNNLGNKVKVFFKVNGEIVKRIIVEKGTTIDAPTDITFPKGYEFIRWDLNDNKFNFNSKINQDTVLEAKLHKNENMFANVTFEYGISNTKTIEVLKGEKIQKPLEDPKLEGHIFIQWELDGKKFDFENTIIENNITLKPKFIKDSQIQNKLKYVVNYYGKDLNSTSYTIIESETIIDDKEKNVEAVIKNFKGFFFDENNSNNKLKGTLKDGNLVLNVYYERKTYTVKFDLNGGSTDPEFNDQNILYQGNVKKPSKDPIKEGYIFIRWELNHLEYKFNEEVSQNIKIYAIYEKIDPNSLKYITEYYVERIIDNNYEIIERKENIGKINEKVDAIIKTFKGFTYEEGNLLNKLSGTLVNNQNRLILKVYYKRNRYNVTFDLDGGIWNIDSNQYKNLKYGSIVANPNEQPTKNDSFGIKYTFTHFELADGSKYNFGNSITDNIHLVAKYTTVSITYNVSFDLNGGKANQEIITQKIKYNELASRPNITPYKDKTKLERYTFKYWTLNNQEFIFEDHKITSNITLIAFYEINNKASYKIEYYQENLNDNKYTKFETITLETISNSSVTIENKVYEGFKFNSNHVSNIKNGVATNDDKLVLKAYYDRNRYNVIFNLDGGSSTMEKEFSVKHGELIKEPINEPIKEGFIFSHYEVDNEKFLFTTKITKHTTLIAIYIAKETAYTIEHYLENIDNDEYTKTVKIKYGKTDTNANAEIEEIIGFTFDNSNPLNIKNGIITADGKLVLKLYYKRNRYTVRFNLNGGNGIIDDIHNIKHGAVIYKPNVEITKSSSISTTYTFKEWKLNNNTFNFITPITNSIVLDAFYEETVRKYNISYNLNGGHTSGDTSTFQLEYNQLVPAPVFKVDKDDDETHSFKFKYWSYNNEKFNFTSHRVTSDIELKAEFESKILVVNVHVVLKADETIIGKTSYNVGEIINNLKVSKQYYNFIGFSLTPNGDVETTIYASKNLTLYPKFKGKNEGTVVVYLKYEKESGSLLPSDTNYKLNNLEIGSIFTLNPENREGYEVDENNSTLSVKVEPAKENIIIVRYSRKIYTITFDSSNVPGVPILQPQYVKHGDTAREPSIYKDNLKGKLYGWSLSEGKSNKQENFNFKNGITRNIKLYINYEHDFNLDSGNKFPQTKVTDTYLINILNAKVPFKTLKSDSHNENTFQDEINYLFHENGDIYEKFNNEYFKYETIEWVKGKNGKGFYTKKVIDFTYLSNHEIHYEPNPPLSYSSLYFKNFIAQRIGNKNDDFSILTEPMHNGEGFTLTDYAKARRDFNGNRKYGTKYPNRLVDYTKLLGVFGGQNTLHIDNKTGQKRVIPGEASFEGLVVSKGFYMIPNDYYPMSEVTSKVLLQTLDSPNKYKEKRTLKYNENYGYKDLDYYILKNENDYYIKYHNKYFRYDLILFESVGNGRWRSINTIDVAVVFNNNLNDPELKSHLGQYDYSISRNLFGFHNIRSFRRFKIPNNVFSGWLGETAKNYSEFALYRLNTYYGELKKGFAEPIHDYANLYFIKPNSGYMLSRGIGGSGNYFVGIVLEQTRF